MTGIAVARVGQPEVLGPLEEVVEPDHDPGLDRRDVERELERGAKADRARARACRPGSG